MSSFASSATTGGACKHAWTKNPLGVTSVCGGRVSLTAIYTCLHFDMAMSN